MKFKAMAVLFLAAVLADGHRPASADENLPSLKVGDMVYTNVTITKVTATDIFFTSSAGMGNAKLKNLDPVLQKHFHYDAAKAGELEKARAQANSQYHVQVAAQPAVHPPDMSRKPEAKNPWA